MKSSSLGHILEILLSGGGGMLLLGIFNTIYKRITGKSEAIVNTAKVLQGMTLDLVEPFREELKEARVESAALRKDLEELRGQFDEMIAWARLANAELRKNGLSVGPIPIRVIAGSRGN